MSTWKPDHLFEVVSIFRVVGSNEMIAFKAGSLCYEEAVADAAAI